MVVSLLTGCASVPMASPEHDAQAKSLSCRINNANTVRELGELYIAEIVNVQFKRPKDIPSDFLVD